MITAERPSPAEVLEERIYSYLPSKEVLKSYPNPKILEEIEFDNRDVFVPGASYVLVTSRYDNKLVIVPYNHPENAIPPETPGAHYGFVAFEGISLVPEDEDGTIVGANLVLFGERMARFRNSIRALGGHIPSDKVFDQFEQGLIDLASVLGEGVIRDSVEGPVRAYLRPAYMRLGNFGVAPPPEAPYHLAGQFWRWAHFKEKEVYERGAVAVSFLDAQRLDTIRGKIAGNYPFGGLLTKIVERDLGKNEVLYLGPYIVNGWGRKEYINYQAGEEAKAKLVQYGMPVDGSGEDVLFEGWDGTLYYQPRDTNILAGTTREYIIRHMAPRLGIKVQERPVSFEDMRKREIVGMSYVGNAVKALKVLSIQIHDTHKPEGKLVETISLTLSPSLELIEQTLARELNHDIEPSYPSLLTRVDLKGGVSARKVLDKAFEGWF